MISIICKYNNDFNHNMKLFDNKHYSNHMFDGFSLSHIYYGILYTAIFREWWMVLTVAIFFEIIENSPYISRKFRKNGYHNNKDSIINILGDLICAMIGFLIYTNTPKKYRLLILLVFIVNEIIFLSNKDLKEYSAIYLLYKNTRSFFR